MVGVLHRSSRSSRRSRKADSGGSLLRGTPFAHMIVLVQYVRTDTGRMSGSVLLPYPEDQNMYRGKANGRSFKKRANKTHRVNMAFPRRGGIRL